jgi:type IV secretory pathway VirB3-like protein
LALGISIVADILDFLAAPIFGIPIIGDMFDVIVTGLLYLITRSKVSVVMNLAEFIPFLGDFLPVYTVSTILWIARDQEFDKLLIIRKIFNLFSNKQNNI